MNRIDLPPLADQADRLISLGVHESAGLTARELRARAAQPVSHPGPALLVIAAAPSRIAGLIRWRGKAGFIVSDMTDVDEFTPIPEAAPPPSTAYAVVSPSRGEEYLNWTPTEALPDILARDRTPLTVAEGIHLLLQAPQVLERGKCFMTIGSRRTKPTGGWDARTPALWLSNGTGRDGRANKDAPKVGWCWAGNRHTWLGIASAATRRALSP